MGTPRRGKQITAEERIYPRALERIREEIADADGREVLCVGKVDAEGRVVSISVAARGNEGAVPALFPHMERGDVVIHNHPSGKLYPSDADIGVASQLGNQGIGFFIVDSRVTRLYVVAEPVLPSERVPLRIQELRRILEPGGKLSQTLPFYEPRPAQLEMLEAVGQAFNEGEICLVEAGTGVGKSLAYLVPAVQWVARNEERVVISTATINLQEQLFEKDLPLVLRLLDQEVPVALVKGRGNYLCWTRLAEAQEEATLFDENKEQWEALRAWAESTPTGSRADLPYLVEEGVWSHVCSESDVCAGLRCENRERCFFLKARRQAASARLLVANHHLLFSDLSFRIQGAGYESSAVLPAFRKVVLDEAHNIENSATSLFTESLNRFILFRPLGRLLRVKGVRKLGLAVKLSNKGASGSLISRMSKEVLQVREEFLSLEREALGLVANGNTFRFSEDAPLSPKGGIRARLETRRGGRQGDKDSGKALVKGKRKKRKLPPGEGKGMERVSPDEETVLTAGPAGGDFYSHLGAFQRSVLNLAETLSEILQSLPEEEGDSPEAHEGRMILHRLEGMATLCQQFGSPTAYPDRVLWIEKKRASQGEVFLEFHSTPLDIAPLMREALYEPMDAVVCTSATLTVNKSFSFWKSRVGLSDPTTSNLTEYRFDSPFDYKRRVLMGIPTDAPPADSEEYVSFLHSFLVKACELTEGRALVLFTSFDALSRVYALVKPELARKGITVYRQGEEERSRLLNRFNLEVSSVLFATDSFWEGIDAPGETLELVVLCRLPFRVPTDPVQVARMEAIQSRGGNPFLELSLPEAVMKLRQGFGRLMRRSTDRGIVLITDARVVHKSYGKIFLSSLPDTSRSIKGSEELLIDVENFLGRIPQGGPLSGRY